MRLLEHQGKALLREHGIAVPRGEVCGSPSGAADAAALVGGPVVLKAQVPVGGRGKAGGIVAAETTDDAAALAAELLLHEVGGYPVRELLVEERLRVAEEWYAAVTLDRAAAAPVVLCSRRGGVDVEQAAREAPGAICRLNVNPLWGFHPYQARGLCLQAGIPAALREQVTGVLLGIWGVFSDCDCELVEVNPLVLTEEGALVAGDAKVVVDDSALFRQPRMAVLRRPGEGTPAGRRAAELGLSYVELEGPVGLAGNGAGLVMATLDALHRAGGAAADFLDLGGSADEDLVRGALEVLALHPGIRAAFVNVFGGITRCDVVAAGLIKAAVSGPLPWPVVVRLAGTNAAQGLGMLRGSPYAMVAGLEEGARRAVELAGSGNPQRGSARQDDAGRGASRQERTRRGGARRGGAG